MSSFLGRLAQSATSAASTLLGRGARQHQQKKPTHHHHPTAERTRCEYGAKCYRQNPQHRIDTWHPGDPEEANDNDDEDDDGQEKAAAGASASNEEEAEPEPEPKPAPAVKRTTSRTASKRNRPPASIPEEPEEAPVTATPAGASPLSRSNSTTDGGGPLEDSPRQFDKKMSVRQRRAKQKEEQEAAAAVAAQQAATLAAAAVPVEPASSPSSSPPSSAPTLSRASTSVSSATPLLASLHSLFRTALIPEFTEIRAPAPPASADSGVFYIGRSSEGKVGGDTQAVKVDLVLQTTNAKLSKMISRVHAKITWTRTMLPPTASKGRGTTATRRGKASATVPTVGPLEPSYTYAWSIHDLGSVNGLFVNHVKISSTHAHTLTPDDRIIFGGGAGIDAGTYHKAKAEDAEFVFRFNCKTREGPEAAEAHEVALEEIQEEPERPRRVYSTVRKVASKRPHSTTVAASAPSSKPSRKRSKASIPEGDEGDEEGGDGEQADEEGRQQPPSDEESRSGSPAPMDVAAPDDEGATQDAGGYMDTAEDAGGATQDYHDADRADARLAAGADATQDFGSGGDSDDRAAGTATQDGAGMFE